MNLTVEGIRQILREIGCKKRKERQNKIREEIRSILGDDSISEKGEASRFNENLQATIFLGKNLLIENCEIKRLLNLLDKDEVSKFMRTLSPKNVLRIKKIYETKTTQEKGDDDKS